MHSHLNEIKQSDQMKIVKIAKKPTIYWISTKINVMLTCDPLPIVIDSHFVMCALFVAFLCCVQSHTAQRQNVSKVVQTRRKGSKSIAYDQE